MDAFTERNGALLHASGQPVSTTVAGDVEYLTHYARLIASAFSRGGGFTFAGVREPGNEIFFRIDRSGSLLGVSGTGDSGWSRMLHESGS